MVIVIVHHTFKDWNAFCSRAMDWKHGEEYKYIKTYSALPLKNEAWCIWDVQLGVLANFQKEFSKALGDAGTAEAAWVSEFTFDTFPPFQYVPKK
jgi:hypothetical protein